MKYISFFSGDRIMSRLQFEQLRTGLIPCVIFFSLATILYSCKDIPKVQTKDVTNVTATSATIGGSVIDEQNSSIIVFGICYGTSEEPTITDNSTIETGSYDNFESNLTGLTPATKYYARAYATNAEGHGYGIPVMFVTAGILVETSLADSITMTSARTGGTIVEDGDLPVLAKGICWSSSHNPTIGDNKAEAGTGTDPFKIRLTGLNPNTVYHVRAYITNASGTFYGVEKYFSTSKLPAIWESCMEFSALNWPNNILLTDSLNIWATVEGIINQNPVSEKSIIVIRSRDAGRTWTAYEIPGTSSLSFTQISAVDGNNAWISIKTKGLLKTSDGGSTWEVLNDGSYFKNYSVSVHFFDLNEGVGRFSAGDSIALIRTSDGGQTWSDVPYTHVQGDKLTGESSYYHGNGPLKAIGDTVAFPTVYGRVFISYDRGNNWKILTYGQEPPYETFGSMAIINSKRFALASGASNYPGSPNYNYYGYTKIIATEDGGLTWLPEVRINTLYLGNISSIPGDLNTYVVSFYRIFSNSGGTFISKNGGRNFVSADSLNINMGVTAFYSKYHGFGASFNINTSPTMANRIYKLVPYSLFRKVVWK